MELISLIYYILLDLIKMYLLCFYIVRLPKSEKKKNYMLAGALVVLIPLSVILLGFPKYEPLISIFLVTMAICSLVKNKRQIAFIILLSILMNLLDAIVSSISYKVLKLNPYDLNLGIRSLLSDLILPIILLVMTTIVQKYVRTTNREFVLKPTYSILLAGGFIVVLLFIDSMFRIAFFETTEAQRTNALITATISVIFFIVLSVFSIYLLSKNHHKTIEALSYKRQVETQQNYYESLLEKEEYTKAFRHDIINHLSCVMSMLERGQVDDAQNYLQQLVNKTLDLNRIKKSGNRIIDIVINDIFTQNNDIFLDWQGLVPDHIKIDDIDLASLFFNVLSNAVEAMDKVKDSSLKKICVITKVLDSSLMFIVNNPYIEEIKLGLDGLPATTKTEKSEHGYGSKNIQEIVNKYHGFLEYEINEKFVVKVTFLDVFNETK